jgi:PAS domain S-box-containing protein
MTGHQESADVFDAPREEHTGQRDKEKNVFVAGGCGDLQHHCDVLRTIFESMRDGLLLLNHEGVVLTANHASAGMLGVSVETLAGCSWHHLCHIIARGQHTRTPLPSLADLHRLFDQPARNRAWHTLSYTNGTTPVLDIHLFPLYHKERVGTQQPAVAHIALHLVDVTQQKARSSLMHEHEQIQSSRELMSTIAHEVNSPLQTVLTALILLEEASDAERTELLRMAQAEVERIGQMLHQLDRYYQDR